MNIRTRATSVYGVLQHIVRLEQEEPKRLDMRSWVGRYKGEKMGQYDNVPNPPCGTVCCHAGWICTATGSIPSWGGIGGQRALSILFPYAGVRPLSSQDDFPYRRQDLRNKLESIFLQVPTSRPGTKLHLKEAQAPLLEFMARYKKELKEMKIQAPVKGS